MAGDHKYISNINIVIVDCFCLFVFVFLAVDELRYYLYLSCHVKMFWGFFVLFSFFNLKPRSRTGPSDTPIRKFVVFSIHCCSVCEIRR